MNLAIGRLFGKGYSTLGHLRLLKVDVLKIDPQFVKSNVDQCW